MIVTEITELNKKKSKIYIDQEFAFVLYKGEIRHYQIKKDQPISDELYHTIYDEVLCKRAKLRCMNLLKNREYTTMQMRRKLQEGLYPEDIIQQAIDYVTSYHYLDDERYAEQYISYQIEQKSRKKIVNDLLQKGISKELIELTFEKLEEEGIFSDEEAKIIKFLEKKGYSSETANDSEKNKLIGNLYRKGFSLDTIYRVMKNV